MSRANTMMRRIVAATAAAATGTLLVPAGIASAHIDPDPVAIEAGKPATVAFNVEHGCNGSPTTSLAFKLPSDVTDAKPVTKAGWTGTVASGVLTFSGGSLGATTQDTFSISFTAPATAELIRFPVVQTCAVGLTNWLDVPVAGQPEPDHPAPTITVTAGPPTSAELTPPTDGPDVESSTPAAPTAATAITATTAVASTTTVAAPSTSKGAGKVVAIVAVAIVVIGVIGVIAARKRAAS